MSRRSWAAIGLLPSVEEVDDLANGLAVVPLLDRLDAGSLAAVDVVQEARPLEDTLALGDVEVAGPNGKIFRSSFSVSSTLEADAYGPKYRLRHGPAAASERSAGSPLQA